MVKKLVFDLDNTLYPESLKIEEGFLQEVNKYLIDVLKLDDEKIKEIYLEFEKNKDFVENSRKFGFDVEKLFDFVCDVDVSKVSYNKDLENLLKNISYEKFIYTNSTHGHVEDTLRNLKLEKIFPREKRFAICDANYNMKPKKESFTRFFEKMKIDPKNSIFFEDNLSNLEKAKKLGMKTVLIDEFETHGKPEFCDYVFKDINQALKEMFLD